MDAHAPGPMGDSEATHIAAALVGKSFDDTVTILSAAILAVMEQTDASGRKLVWRLLAARVMHGISLMEDRETQRPVGRA